MIYHSTRSRAHTADSAQAVLKGLAPDGGLYWPEKLPAFDVDACLAGDTYSMAERMILCQVSVPSTSVEGLASALPSF